MVSSHRDSQPKPVDTSPLPHACYISGSVLNSNEETWSYTLSSLHLFLDYHPY
jgi:hypothetical protein